MDDTRIRNRAAGLSRPKWRAPIRRAFLAACGLAVAALATDILHAQKEFDRPTFPEQDVERGPEVGKEAPRFTKEKAPPRRLLQDLDPDEVELPESPSRPRAPGELDLKFLGADKPLVAVRIEGNETIPESAISQHIRTRTDRPADERQIREDVRALYATRWFYSVEPRVVEESKGLVLVFNVLERPIVHKVEYQGRKKIKEKTLAAETGLKVGSPFDLTSNREAARRLEQFYHEKGFAFATVELDRGGNEGDREVVFRIHEGPKVRVTSVKFDGNNDFSDQLLATKLSTKKAILWLFGGKYDPSSTQDDTTAIKQYYHSLGYFDVKIDHRVGFSEDRSRAHIEYFITEGQRYKVRNVEFAGNRIFSKDELGSNLKLSQGKHFNARFLEKDLDGIKGKYGETGRIFARVEAVPRFLATPGEADLVYNINEDKPYRIGRIDVALNKGEDSHTKRSVLLNSMLVKSGDLADPKKIEKSKRRISGSQVFEGGPGQQAQGPSIKIAKRDDDIGSEDEMFRGQNEDDFADFLRSQRVTVPSGWQEPGPAPKYAAKPAQPTNATVPSRSRSATVPTSYRPPQAANRNGSPYSAPRDSEYKPAPRSTGTPVRATQVFNPAARREVAPPAPRPLQSVPVAVQRPAIDPKAYGHSIELDDSDAIDVDEAETVLALDPIEPQDAFFPKESGFIIRAQNAFEGPVTAPGNPIYGNSPQGDPFNDRLAEPPPPGIVDLTVEATEARTGRLMFGVGVNSDAGVVGSIVLTEQNFDILRPPTSFRDIIEGNAWRGAGQKFRLEAVPGDQVSRYMASWTDPFFLDTPYSLGVSGFYYQRFMPDWKEERAGGRITVGRQLTPQLSVSGALRLEYVELSNPDTPIPQLLYESLGANFLSTARFSVAHDTRDAPFLPGEGHYINASYEQAFGDFDYPRLELEASQYFTLYARPDGGGRHILTLSSQLGWTGDNTPIFERFFAGGFQTFRGFAFRGVGPVDGNVRIGGQFMAIGTVEYMFPVLANEMLQLVAFTDFGTVENQVGFQDFRMTVGGGLRVTVPAMGPVPLAFDWGIPIIRDDNDDTRVFSFYVGVQR
jgi:outer membrane protein insertion porin family